MYSLSTFQIILPADSQNSKNKRSKNLWPQVPGNVVLVSFSWLFSGPNPISSYFSMLYPVLVESREHCYCVKAISNHIAVAWYPSLSLFSRLYPLCSVKKISIFSPLLVSVQEFLGCLKEWKVYRSSWESFAKRTLILDQSVAQWLWSKAKNVFATILEVLEIIYF